MQTKADIAEREQALEYLRKELKPGDVLFTVVRHVTKSGMRRSISVLRSCVDENGTPTIENLDFFVAHVVKERIDRGNGGVYQHGAGMDMGFHIVYTLGRYLWPNGTAKPHGKRNGQPDRDGGYALKQRWL